MSFDLSGVLAKMCVDHAELPEFPVDDHGNRNASLIAEWIGLPVESVAEMHETEARARWKGAHAARWALAFWWQVQPIIKKSAQGRRFA